MTWAEVMQSLTELQQLAVEQARGLLIDSYQKKNYVLGAVKSFLDMVSLPLPWYLKPLVPYVKDWLYKGADGAIEAIYKKLKATQPAVPAS